MIGKAAILDAAARLIAANDYDRVSMAAIARTAKTSTGVLYCRFANKEALLVALSADTLGRLAEVAKQRAEKTSHANEVAHLIEQTVEQLTAAKVAGVVRASIKLAMTHPAALKPLEEYRKTCTDLMVRAVGEADARVRSAMQIVLGAITDSIVTGLTARADTLTEMFESYV